MSERKATITVWAVLSAFIVLILWIVIAPLEPFAMHWWGFLGAWIGIAGSILIPFYMFWLLNFVQEGRVL